MNSTSKQISQEPIEIACKEIAKNLVDSKNLTRSQVFSLIKGVASKYKLKTLPKHSTILLYLPEEHRDKVKNLLKVKPVRTSSGIVVFGVMTKPFTCPHGTCIYCPGGARFGTPQSYTGYEPAAMRAIQNEFDPKRQIKVRLEQLKQSGHDVDKIELIIMGGTFLGMPKDYQYWFAKSCYEAIASKEFTSIEEAKSYCEKTPIRIIGLTIETRPDWCKERHVDNMLLYGATRVEIGVQIIDDEIYKLVNRGHNVNDVIEAFRIARDAGYKIVAHMMPGLPGSNPKKDLESFRKLFYDSKFKPDMLKIYPTLVVEGTKLYEMYKNEEYKPYNDETMINLVAEVKKIVPRWVRIMRIQREIPAWKIKAGIKKSNLRQLALEKLKKEGKKCNCIRCREVGLRKLKEGIEPNNVQLLKDEYEAGEGKEIFLSFEDLENEILVGFLRLRVPSDKAHRREINLKPTCIVRELHVYGQMVPVGIFREDAWQHKGYGVRLMHEAEEIAKEYGAKKMVVISGVGVREYYRGLGYRLEGPYMVKEL